MLAPRSKLILAFAIIYIVWGSTYLAIRYAVETLPPFLFAATRFLVAGTILYLWARTTGSPRPARIHWRNGFIIGTLLLLIGNGGVVWAEQTVPSGIAALLVAVVPIWLVLLDWLRPGGRRPSWGVMFGVIVGLVGMVELIGLNDLQKSTIPLAGAVVLMLASLSWAAGTLYAKTAEMPHSLIDAALEMIGGGTGLLIAATVTGEFSSLDISKVSKESALALLYLIIFGSLIAYSAYSWLVRHASPASVGTYAYINPVIAVLLGWLIAHEPITRQTLIGAGIIVGAVAIITTAQAKSAQDRANRQVQGSDGSS
jgi:drug/metabolite transporter (DMT)-like permease